MNRRAILRGAAGLAAVSFGGEIAFGGQTDAPDQKKVAAGENPSKQLLLLMDTDKNGKISKDEYMKFMAAEFDRLDTDKSGELDVKELQLSKLRPSRGAVTPHR